MEIKYIICKLQKWPLVRLLVRLIVRLMVRLMVRLTSNQPKA
jgi:hypothetical protein